MQLDLDFTRKMPAAAQIRIADGMQAADDHAAKWWKDVFDACVLAAATKQPEIVSDDVLTELEALPHPPQTHNLAAIGPAMIRAAAKGFIRRTDRVRRSLRPEKHGNRQNVWISNLYKHN